MAAAKKTKKLTPTWSISVLRRKGEHLGVVEAADADEAIKVAIERFGISDPERRRRLVVHHVR